MSSLCRLAEALADDWRAKAPLSNFRRPVIGRFGFCLPAVPLEKRERRLSIFAKSPIAGT